MIARMIRRAPRRVGNSISAFMNATPISRDGNSIRAGIRQYIIIAATPISNTTFKIAFVNSISPFAENVRFAQERGLILLPLNSRALGAKFIPPITVWVASETTISGKPITSPDSTIIQIISANRSVIRVGKSFGRSK